MTEIKKRGAKSEKLTAAEFSALKRTKKNKTWFQLSLQSGIDRSTLSWVFIKGCSSPKTIATIREKLLKSKQ